MAIVANNKFICIGDHGGDNGRMKNTRFEVLFRVNPSCPDEFWSVTVKKERRDGTFDQANKHPFKPETFTDFVCLCWPDHKLCVVEGVETPLFGCKHDNFKGLNTKFKIKTLINGVQLNFMDKSGAHGYWIPRNKKQYDEIVKKLENRPLSAMGFALQLCRGGPAIRKRYMTLIDKAFGTNEHPFVPIICQELELGIREAFGAVGAIFATVIFQRFFLTVFCIDLIKYVSMTGNRNMKFTYMPGPGNVDTGEHQRVWASIVQDRRNKIPNETPLIKGIMRFLLNCINNVKVVELKPDTGESMDV